MSSLGAIRAYFESEPHGRKVTTAEIRELSADERAELVAVIEAEQTEEVIAA